MKIKNLNYFMFFTYAENSTFVLCWYITFSPKYFMFLRCIVDMLRYVTVRSVTLGHVTIH